jgi:ketosteroid isomerase-like protein
MWKTLLLVLSLPLAVAAQSTADKIIAMERAALDRWGHGDPQGYIDIYAPEITYFDPYQKARIDGLAALTRLYESIKGKSSIPRVELISPRVQMHGDTATLTFNLVNYSATGEATSRWNSTEVYARIKGEWKIIHSHWSLTTPQLK